MADKLLSFDCPVAPLPYRDKQELILLPLRSSVFCANCETLSNATGANCPACGSAALFNLQAVMDRVDNTLTQRLMEDMVCDA